MMNIGPEKLIPTHRYILKNALPKSDLILAATGKIEWKDGRLKDVKLKLRHSLRIQQDGRCIYCRRKIILERRNSMEDIEHYLDKSKPHYKKWIFCPTNLTIACRACNFVKSKIELGDAAVIASQKYSESMGQFKWIHPYFDDYHENIEILRGWVYRVKATAPKVVAAQNMIQDLELDKIVTMHSYASVIKDKIYRLTVFAHRAIQKGNKPRAEKLLALSVEFQRQSWPDY